MLDGKRPIDKQLQEKCHVGEKSRKIRQTWIIEEIRAITGQAGGPEITLEKERYQSQKSQNDDPCPTGQFVKIPPGNVSSIR